MSSDINLLSESEIASRLRNAANKDPDSHEDSPRFPPEIFHGSPQSAAVLVPLLRNEDRWEILYTRRTATLPEHSGQVAFPGGRAEADDPSPEVTALRETEEEINLSMGIAYIGKSNLEKAFACFKKAPNSELAHVFLRNIYTCVMNLEGEERELQILKEEYGSTIALWDKDLRRIAEAVSCADDKIIDKIRHD